MAEIHLDNHADASRFADWLIYASVRFGFEREGMAFVFQFNADYLPAARDWLSSRAVPYVHAE